MKSEKINAQKENKTAKAVFCNHIRIYKIPSMPGEQILIGDKNFRLNAVAHPRSTPIGVFLIAKVRTDASRYGGEHGGKYRFFRKS